MVRKPRREMRPLRIVMRDAALDAAARLDGQAWVQAADGMGWVRRRRVVFSDRDMLLKLMYALSEVCGGTPVTVGNRNQNPLGPPYDDAVDAITTAAPGDRSVIVINGTCSATPGTMGLGWHIYLTAERHHMFPRLSSTGDIPDKDEILRRLMAEVDRFTVPAPRRLRSNAPIIENISMQDANQRAHDAKIASRAARVGGWWGALGGGVLATIVAIVAAIAQRPT
ncbi:hypothetical protein [Cellulomonas xylanilytica]|nr:hypothetical protein [Cellulomonas xylanilytica]